jgi:hypothetical protein
VYRPSDYAQRSRNCASHWRRSLSRAQRPPSHGSTAWGRGPGRSRPTMACRRGPEPGSGRSGVNHRHRLCPVPGCRLRYRPAAPSRSGLGYRLWYRPGAPSWSGAALRSVRCRVAWRGGWSSRVAHRGLRSCVVRRGFGSGVANRDEPRRALLRRRAGARSCLARRRGRCRVLLRPGAGVRFCVALRRWRVPADVAGLLTRRGRELPERCMTAVCAPAHRRTVSRPRHGPRRRPSFAGLAPSAGSRRSSGLRRPAGYVDRAESGCPHPPRLRRAHQGALERALPRCAADLASAASCPPLAGPRRLASGCAAPIYPSPGA